MLESTSLHSKVSNVSCCSFGELVSQLMQQNAMMFMVWMKSFWIWFQSLSHCSMSLSLNLSGYRSELMSLMFSPKSHRSRSRVHTSDAEKFSEVCPCCNSVGWG